MGAPLRWTLPLAFGLAACSGATPSGTGTGPVASTTGSTGAPSGPTSGSTGGSSSGTGGIALGDAGVLPFTFGPDLTDIPGRVTDALVQGPGPEGTYGIPGFDRAGNAYYRMQNLIYVVAKGTGTPQPIDFFDAAAAAVQRAGLTAQDAGTTRPWNVAFETTTMFDTRIVFDRADWAYTIVTPIYLECRVCRAFDGGTYGGSCQGTGPQCNNLLSPILLYSTDHCQTWNALALNGGYPALEARDGWNDDTLPPGVLTFDLAGDLWLHNLVPSYDAGTLTDAPVTVTFPFTVPDGGLPDAGVPSAARGEYSIVAPNHSGGGNSVLRAGGRLYVTYPAKDPGQIPFGTAIYLQSFRFDDAGAEISDPLNPDGGPVFLGYSGDIAPLAEWPLPAADDHNLSALTVDGNGYLYVFFGAHNGVPKYMVSQTPYDIHSFSAPTPFGADLRIPAGGAYPPGGPDGGFLTDAGYYTYLSLNLNRQNTFHLFFRYAGAGYDHTLVQMRCALTPPAGALQCDPWWADWDKNNFYWNDHRTGCSADGGPTSCGWGPQLESRVVVDPAWHDYAAWRQKVSLDDDGNLYLTFFYYTYNLSCGAGARFAAEDPSEAVFVIDGGPCAAVATGSAVSDDICQAEPDSGPTYECTCTSASGPQFYPTTLVSYDHGTSWYVFTAGTQVALP